MKRVNKEGPALLGLDDGAARVPSIRPAAAAALAADGAVIVDMRPAAAFAEGHPDGAINLGFGSKMGYWGGWVLPDAQPLLLLADDPAQAREAAVQLRRVGLDRIEGAIAGGYEAWSGSSLPIARLDLMTVVELRDAIDRGTPMVIIDVRTPREWRSGHIDGAVNVPVGDIPARARELTAGHGLVATICEGGYRSSLAASLLAQEGGSTLVNLTGGMAAFRAMEST
jgi:hydroxyacylglutathione hydrolase